MDGENNILPELYSDECWDEIGGRLRLSRRQKSVARLLCRGMHTDEVAQDLGISTNTVRMHQRYLYRRLDVHDRVGLVIRVVLTARQITAEADAARAALIRRRPRITADERPQVAVPAQ